MMLLAGLMRALPSLDVFAYLSVVAFVAAAMRGFSGFGAGLLMAPLFSLVMEPLDVVALVLLLNLFSTFQMLPEALRHVDWRLVFRLFIPSLLGIPIGLVVIHSINPVLLRQIVALVVSLVAVIMLAGWHYDGRRGRVQDALAGSLSGVLTSIAGIGGPPIVLYLLSDRKLSVVVFRAVCIAYFLMVQVGALTPMLVAGSITPKHGFLVLAMLPLYGLATWLGTHLHHLSVGRYQAQARRVSLWMLLGIGLVTLFL